MPQEGVEVALGQARLWQRLARRDVLGRQFGVGNEEPSWTQGPPVHVEGVCTHMENGKKRVP